MNAYLYTYASLIVRDMESVSEAEVNVYEDGNEKRSATANPGYCVLGIMPVMLSDAAASPVIWGMGGGGGGSFSCCVLFCPAGPLDMQPLVRSRKNNAMNKAHR